MLSADFASEHCIFSESKYSFYSEIFLSGFAQRCSWSLVDLRKRFSSSAQSGPEKRPAHTHSSHTKFHQHMESTDFNNNQEGVQGNLRYTFTELATLAMVLSCLELILTQLIFLRWLLTYLFYSILFIRESVIASQVLRG